MDHLIATNAPKAKTMSRRKIIVATTLGNALEYFDFTVYGYLAILIGKLFFPAYGQSEQLLFAIGSFGVGFVMRPLGGFVIGAYADRRGRKPAMTLTISLMAAGCLLIAISPTYTQIGITAPLILVFARLTQGFSAGGEFGASTALLVEQSMKHNRGFSASWQIGSQGLGVMLGALTVGFLNYFLSVEDMTSWGWRVPFGLGLLIGPVGMYLRRNLHESHIATPGTVTATDHSDRGSLRTLFSGYGLLALKAVVMLIGGTTGVYVVSFYLPTYAVRELGMSTATPLFGAMLTGGVMFLLSPLVGVVADRVGRKSLIVAGRLALAIFIYPAFLWLSTSPQPMVLLTISTVLGILLTVQAVPTVTMLPEMFPAHIRAVGMSVVYSVGVSLFGGTAPFISAWSVNALHSKMAPAWYVLVMTAVSLVALAGLKDNTGVELT